MADILEFTTAEAAFVLRESVKAIRKAIDDGPVEARLVQKPGGAVRALQWKDLVYLFAMRSLRDELTPKARNEFYHALKRFPVEQMQEVRIGRLSIVIEDLKTELQDRTRELTDLAEKVEFREDGEAVLKSTNVEVYRIAALLSGGLTPQEIGEDYPSLTQEQIATAKAYSEAHPKPGRPYPGTTAKRALKGAELEALDDVLDK